MLWQIEITFPIYIEIAVLIPLCGRIQSKSVFVTQKLGFSLDAHLAAFISI